MAKAFRFRLEVVERVRREAVDRERRAVAEALRAVQRAEQRRSSVNAQLRELTMQSRDAKQAALLDIASLRGQQYFRGWLADQAMKVQTELAGRREALETARRRLAEASSRLKVIEKLRERQWHRYQREQNRREQLELDEAALGMFHRAGVRRRFASIEGG